MHTLAEVMAELEARGDPRRVRAFAPHGAPDGLLGVSVADMKVIARKIRGRQELACELYASGNPDAMYLAGLVADGSRLSRRQLDGWARGATWQMLSEYTVPRVAARSRHARELARRWIDSEDEGVASSGWNTYAGIVAVVPDAELDLAEIETLLDRIETGIGTAPNRVRYTMNGFVISVGTYVLPLVGRAKEAARRLGKVHVEMNGTSCKVPLATAYIEKVERAGRTGRKRRARR